MQSTTRFAAALMLSLVAALRADAQVVVGVVVQRDSTTPLAGAIVLAMDANGAVVNRTIASQAGRFTMTMPTAGTFVLEVLRIGFRPTVAPPVTVTVGAQARVRIIFSSNAVVIPSIAVRERETCRINADSGLVVAQLWQEARKAMLTTQLESSDAPLIAEWIEYDRTLDSTARLVHRQRVRSVRHPTTHAFRSVPASVLHDVGYVVEDKEGVNYHAPDAIVALTDEFVADHCFHLAAPSSGGDDLVGVAFVPTGARRGMREIEGTFWLKRSTSELQRLEFRYTNLGEQAAAANPGGVVEFAPLVDGLWLVTRWSIRMPQTALRETRSGDGTRRVTQAKTLLYLRAVQVAGGEVLSASRAGRVVYRQVGPTLSLQLVTPQPRTTLGGTRLSLTGTDYRGTADSTGLIRISPVLAGRYDATLLTPSMQTLGAPPVQLSVEARLGAQVDSIVVPAEHDVVARACKDAAARQDDGVLFGTVLDEHARGLADIAVTTRWQDNQVVTAGMVGARTISTATRTDAFGNWRLCGVSTRTTVVVIVAVDSLTDIRRVRLDDRPYARIDLTPRIRARTSGDMDP